MDNKIKVKQEIVSELASQNETESFPKDLAMNKNRDTIKWYEDFKMGIKTEIKQEAPVTDCFPQDERQIFTNDYVKKIKIDTCRFRDGMDMDTKTNIISDIYSENDRQFFPKDLIKDMKEFSSDCEIEIKEEPWWLETTTHASSDCEQIKDGRNAAELPRLNTDAVSDITALTHIALVGNDTSLNPGQPSSEVKETTKSTSDIRETFLIEESLCSKHPGRHNGEIVSIVSTQQNNSYGSYSNNNIICKSSLVRHDLTDRFRKMYKHDTYHKSFTQLSNHKQHRIDNASEMSDLEQQHNLIHEGIKPQKCEICDKTFTRLSDLKRHNLIHEGVKPYKCEICEKAFTRLSSLKQHNLIHEGVKPHKCDICEKTFTQMSHLKQHNLIHVSVKLHKCEICEKAFTHLSSLNQHNLIHECVKPFTCEICEKTFTRLSSLKQHNLTHEGVKPHKCEICEKTFTHLSTLKQHNLIHEGLKPHKCEICEKSFTQISSLKRHNLIHEGVKPHKCEICKKTFTHLSSLKQHNLIHEGVKPHRCEICEKSFTQVSSLKQHNLIHEGVKPHKCEICDKTFTRMSHLKQHNLVH